MHDDLVAGAIKLENHTPVTDTDPSQLAAGQSPNIE
jgi:hypothetical protein